MRSKRVAAAVLAAAVAAGSGVAVSLRAGAGDVRAEERAVREPPTTAVRPRATAAPSTTTTTAPSTTSSTAGSNVLRAGSRGEPVRLLQQRLKELSYDPGAVDGRFGHATTMAVWAFQKLHGQSATGRVTPDLWALMQATEPPPPLLPDGGPKRVEVDLGRQVLLLYTGGNLRLITHISTGSGKNYCENGNCGTAVTPGGSYRFTWRYPRWRISPLGRLYNPVYFNGGIAIHGSPSVPSYPASHGCVRIPMHIAEYFPSLVSRGDPVYVFGGGRQPHSLAGEPVAPPGPPPDDPPTDGPGSDETTTTSSSTTTTTRPLLGTTSTTSSTSSTSSTSTTAPPPSR